MNNQTAILYAIERIESDFNARNLPPYMWGAVSRYLQHGIEPGGFLKAVLCNDLFGAYARADNMNTEVMKDWCMFIYNAVPGGCHGSVETYERWVELGGLEGVSK